MKRLTKKETIVIRGREMAACNYENDECNDQCRYRTCRWQEKANMILKNYEDTGLSPEQVMELKERDTVKECKQSVFDHDSITCVCGSDMDKDVEFRFCPWCGQKLKKWEDN